MKAPSELGANGSSNVDSPPVPRKNSRFWRNLGLLSLLAIVGGATYVTFTPEGQGYSKDVRAIVAVQQNPNLLFDNARSDRVNILLIGRDVNWKETKVYDPTTKTFRRYHVHDESAPARSDTMIVVSLDKAKHTMRMVSLPRDARVYIPENTSQTGVAKLNSAHAFGGPELLIKTLHDELGITIHRYAVIRFGGFKQLIDQVGGVEINVDGALKRNFKTGKLYRGRMKYDDNYGNLHIDLQPGMQTLNGQQAHDYVRFRMDEEGDPGRIRRQQQVMRALAKKIMSSSPLAIPGLVKDLRGLFTPTDISTGEMASAANFARGLGDASKIQPVTLFGIYGRRGSIVLNRRKNEKLLSYVLGPTFNPESFLGRSPSARGDDIGSANESNPATVAILKAAGIEVSDATARKGVPVVRETSTTTD